MKKLISYQLRKLFLSIAIVLTVFVSDDAEAAWTNFAQITALNLYNGVLYVRLTDSLSTSCPAGAGFWYVFLSDKLDATQVSFNQYYALMLTAVALKNPISISTNSCFAGYPKADAIRSSY